MKRNKKQLVNREALDKLWQQIESVFGEDLSSGTVYDKNRDTYGEDQDYQDLINAIGNYLKDQRNSPNGHPIAKKRAGLGKSVLYEDIYLKMTQNEPIRLTYDVVTILCLYAGYEGVEGFIEKEGVNDFFEKMGSGFSKEIGIIIPERKITSYPEATSTVMLDEVDFVGREFLYQEVQGFLKTSSNGYFVIEGDPGIGKTAFAKNLVLKYGCPHHLNIRSEGIVSSKHFYHQICGQLHSKFLPPATSNKFLLNPNIDLFKELIHQISRETDEVIILVDALDEAQTSEIIGENPLLLPQSLPKGVFVIITTRKDQRNIFVKPGTEQLTYALEAGSENNLVDIRKYIQLNLKKLQSHFAKSEVVIEAVENQLIQQSEGNFMFLSYFFHEIKKGRFNSFNLKELPKGLKNYYRGHINLMRQHNNSLWQNIGVPLLATMVAVKEALSVELLLDFSGINDRKALRHFLREWEQFFKRSLKDNKPVYRFYHLSFLEFLNEDDEIVDELEFVNERIQNYWEDFFRPNS